MAIKFEKIQPGMVLYDRHREQAGNTTLRRWGEWEVYVKEVYPERREALASWNNNPPRIMYEHALTKLSTWSMYDKDVAEVTHGFGGVSSFRKLTKAERTAREAAKNDAVAAAIRDGKGW